MSRRTRLNAATGVADAVAAYVGQATPVAPVNPKVGQMWLSSALADLHVPPHAYDRIPITTVAGPDGDANQEPSVWTDATSYRMLYTAGNGLWLQSCPLTSDPMVPANWTKYTTSAVVGAGNGVAQINHASVYDPNPGQTTGNVYCFGNDQAGSTIKVYSAAKSAPTTWTMIGQCLALTDMPAGALHFGNTYVTQNTDGTFVMAIEYQDSATRWQIAQASCATVAGTYARITDKNITLYPNANWSMVGGPWLTRENGQWVMAYHGGYGAFGNLPTEIFRATSPSLLSDNWTVLDQGKQFIKRTAKYEVDQCADFEMARAPDGQCFAFWTGLDNRSPLRARIYASRMLPTLKRWNGSVWVSQETKSSASTGQSQAVRPTVFTYATDFSGTATTWTDIPSLSTVWAPAGTDFEVQLHGVFTPSGDSTTRYQFRLSSTAEVSGSPTTVTVSMGAIAGTSGVPVTVSASAVIPRAIPGNSVPVKIQYQVTSGATLNCRPIAQAGFEYATLKVTDIKYRPSVTLD